MSERNATPCGVLQSVATALRKALGTDIQTAAERTLARLREILPKAEDAPAVVLVPFGGGKDSSFVVALTRHLQLELKAATGTTFTLRVATNYQAGMAVGVTPNIDRVYTALGLYDDPTVELLAVAGDRVEPFHPRYVIPPEVLAFNRLGVLMNGHRTAGANRAMFCNSCNFSMVKSFDLALRHDGRPAAVVITGDSRVERRKYYRAIARMAQERGVPTPARHGHGFAGFLRTTGELAVDYNADLFGSDDAEASRYRTSGAAVGSPTFFSLFEDLEYAAGAHWELLTGFLGFQFHELAFSFTESDCANPTLMCHLRGLKAERLWKRTYAEGVAEYVAFALDMMRRKQFPPQLIREMEERYGDPVAVERTRAVASEYATNVFGLSEDHLVCLLFAPFTGGAQNLFRYLSNVKPTHLALEPAIRRVLSGSNDPFTADLLAEWSGLDLLRLRTLFRSPLIDTTDPTGATQLVGPIGVMFRQDPHQAVIATRHSPGGPAQTEVESGR